jgi:hypothetical protein
MVRAQEGQLDAGWLLRWPPRVLFWPRICRLLVAPTTCASAAAIMLRPHKPTFHNALRAGCGRTGVLRPVGPSAACAG